MSTQFTNRQWRLPNNENKDKQSNYSMDFDVSQYIDLGDDDIFSFGDSANDSPFSISAWIYMDSTTNFRIVSKYDAPNYEYQFDVGGSSNLRFYVFDGSSYRARTGSTLSINQWYHVVATYNGVGGANAENGIKIYVDGVEITGTTSSNGSYTAMHNTTAPVYIGRIASSYANGKIDAVSIFNYALSSSQITTLYGSSSTGIGNPMTLNPVAFYQLGDKSAFNGANYLVPNSSLKDYVFDFDGANDYIDCGNISALNNLSEITISFWYKFQGTDTQNGIISQNPIFEIQDVYNAMYFHIDGTSKTINVPTGTFNYKDGNWHNFVCTYKAGDAQIMYIDNTQYASSSTTNTNLPTTTANLNIGRRNNGFRYADMSFSNASIWNTQLTSAQVTEIYNEGIPSNLNNHSAYSNLVSWWQLDASATYDSSTTTWTIPDDSTNSNTGTSSGMTQANLVQSDLSFKTSYSPYALDFDGVSDVISIPYNSSSGLNLLSNFSVSIWINIGSSGFRNGTIGNYNNAGGFAIELRGTLQTPLIRFFIGDSVGIKEATAELSLVQTGWHHIVGTFDGTTLKIYTDSVKGTDATAVSNMVLSTSYLAIGGEPIGNYFDGKLSNASYWNTELTQAQVSEIYNEGVPSKLNNHSAYSNLVSWWQLGSNSSFNTNWTVLDEKGTNNGTSSSMGEDAIVDGVNTYGGGTSSGMGGDEVIGDAPYSTANSLSVNMNVLDRVTDTPS